MPRQRTVAELAEEKEPCPTCGAFPGQACINMVNRSGALRTRGRSKIEVHRERKRLYRESLVPDA